MREAMEPFLTASLPGLTRQSSAAAEARLDARIGPGHDPVPK
jgi:hypothetical protein